MKALIELQPQRVEARLELAAAQIQKRDWESAYAILQNRQKYRFGAAARLFTLLAITQINLYGIEAAKANVDRLAQYTKTDQDRRELDYLRSILASSSAAQTQPAQPPPSAPKPDEVSKREESPVLRRSTGLIERNATTAPLPSVTGKFVELRWLGRTSAYRPGELRI